jgi:hypothetical protein
MKRDRTGAKGDATARTGRKANQRSAHIAKAPSRDDILKLIHELEVHQVEWSYRTKSSDVANRKSRYRGKNISIFMTWPPSAT